MIFATTLQRAASPYLTACGLNSKVSVLDLILLGVMILDLTRYLVSAVYGLCAAVLN